MIDPQELADRDAAVWNEVDPDARRRAIDEDGRIRRDHQFIER